MKLTREEQRMQQPVCSFCETSVERVMAAVVEVACLAPIAQGLSHVTAPAGRHGSTVRICRRCAEHVVETLK